MSTSNVGSSNSSDRAAGHATNAIAAIVATAATAVVYTSPLVTTTAAASPADAGAILTPVTASTSEEPDEEAQALLDCVNTHASMAERLLLPALIHTAEYHNQWMDGLWTEGPAPEGHSHGTRKVTSAGVEQVELQGNGGRSGSSRGGSSRGGSTGGSGGGSGQRSRAPRHPIGSFVEVTDGRSESHTRALEVSELSLVATSDRNDTHVDNTIAQ